MQWKAGLDSSPHWGSGLPWMCGPEKGWPHLCGSSCLICKTRIILTQFKALWRRISVKFLGWLFYLSNAIWILQANRQYCFLPWEIVYLFKKKIKG
jgi:hypothetical protein